MKELIAGLKDAIGDKVKNIYQIKETEINVMLFEPEELDYVYQKMENIVLEIVNPFTLVKINFVNEKEEVLKSLSLTQ